MTRYEAYIEQDWREHGLAHLVVARIRENGSTDYGVFLVDVWCLGVKDAFGETDVPEAALRALVDERLPESMREPIHPACAKKLIAGALAYAEGLGFAPHRDFRKARRVLSGLDASLCPTEFAYGRAGQPCYVQGPDDSADRVDRVLAVLEARCGADGFDFELADEEDENELLAVRQDLMAWLDAEPPEVPRFYALSGMIAALHVCPGIVMPTKVMDALWGPEGRVWADEKEAQDFAALLKDYWNYAGDLVRGVAAPDAAPGEQAIDIWTEDFPEDDPRPMTAAMAEWARGFLRATELWPEAWGDALGRADLAPHWEILHWWAEIVQPGNADRIADAAEAPTPRTMIQSVGVLARALRPADGAASGAAP